MIRKPDAREFRERRAVSTVRDARTLAQAGARGVGEGARRVMLWWFGGIMAFGFVMAAASAIGPVGILAGVGVVAAILFLGGSRRASVRIPRTTGSSQTATATPADRAIAATSAMPGGVPLAGTHELSVAAIGRAAATIAVPAVLLLLGQALVPALWPVTLVGIAMFGLVVMLLARLSGDRVVLQYDAQSVTVRGLLGEATMLWADIDDVTAETCSRVDLKTQFTSGARRNIVLRGARSRLGGATTLLIPIDLIALDHEAVVTLVSRFLMLRAGLGAESFVAPTAIVAKDPPPPPPPPPSASPAAQIVEAPFDPDAIMTRYLAEREALVRAQRADLSPPIAPRTFGRKSGTPPTGPAKLGK